MKTFKIGRSSSNDIVVQGDQVSRQHAEINIDERNNIVIKDLNSSNGIYVNGRRITGEFRLQTGDKVTLGNQFFDWEKAIQQGPKAPAAPAAPRPLPTGDTITVGRSAQAQYQLTQSNVSSLHATLRRNPDGTVTITDNNSTNGTFVNGQRIAGTVPLKSGDQVMLAGSVPLAWEALMPPRAGAAGGATVVTNGGAGGAGMPMGGGGGGMPGGIAGGPMPPMPPQKKSSPIIWIAAALGALVILGGLAAFFLWPKTLTNEEIFNKYKTSVVMIYCESGYVVTVGQNSLVAHIEDGQAVDGPTGGFGTGSFISQQGHIITNRHVAWTEDDIEEGKRIIQEAVGMRCQIEYKVLLMGIVKNNSNVTMNNLSQNLIPCSLIKASADKDLDVAVIQTDDKRLPQGVEQIVDINDIADDATMTLGKRICTIGFPRALLIGETANGLQANNQSGEITQNRGEYQYGHNIVIQPGASGSPVFDERGRFAGLIVSMFAATNGSGYNQAVNPDKAAAFARQYVR